ncbi:MAG TPA: hypothetical protein DDY78_14765 [Planctomycetales bacterium]|jgi:hypothetical protein|nr:hypothetical protein [Planctomycetales bacterium]
MTRYADLLPRYKRLRQSAVRLNSRLVKTLSRNVLNEGGKKLGILRRNVLTLDSADEIAVLMDYCIFNVRRSGVNAVERYLAKSPPPQDSDEMAILLGMRQAHYSLFAVEAVERAVGVHVKDLLRDEPRFLMDVGLSGSAPLGMILATRVMAPEGIGMTGGAALPVGVLSTSERATFLQGVAALCPGVDFRCLSPREASDLTGLIIRTCLQRGAAERVAYVEPKPGRGRRDRRDS